MGEGIYIRSHILRV